MKPSFHLLPLRFSATLLLLSGVTALAGCGQLGPLTMPPKPLNATATAPKGAPAPANAVTPVSSNSPFSTPAGTVNETPVTPGSTTPTPASK